jgi:hypothetical protein
MGFSKVIEMRVKYTDENRIIGSDRKLLGVAEIEADEIYEFNENDGVRIKVSGEDLQNIARKIKSSPSVNLVELKSRNRRLSVVLIKYNGSKTSKVIASCEEEFKIFFAPYYFGLLAGNVKSDVELYFLGEDMPLLVKDEDGWLALCPIVNVNDDE